MDSVKAKQDDQHQVNGNIIIGNPLLADKSVSFNSNSSGNILFCEDRVDLRKSTISFNGNNSLVYLSKNKHSYQINVSIHRDNVLFFGEDNYFNGKLNLILSERKHIVIGDNGLFSFGIWLRTADPHLIYSCQTHERINPSKNILIGDHVWIGQGALILKGTTIASGSIVGANSTVSGKHICSNESWAGSPAKKISEGIFFDGACVHNWTETQTNTSQIFNSNKWIFCDEASKGSSITSVFKQFDSLSYAEDRLRFIQSKPKELQGKQRFASTKSKESQRQSAPLTFTRLSTKLCKKTIQLFNRNMLS